MKRVLRDNGLSLVLLLLFLAFWAGQSVACFHVYNGNQALHGNPVLTFPSYLASGHFWRATFFRWAAT